jgi:NtrC-family two-component system sensor histidine kinase KinB
MKALVSDLLDLSKIEAGRIDLDFESVPVQTLFEYIQAIFGKQLEMKQIEIAAELSEDLPRIRADVNKVTWVLTNLMSNALRYVSEGGHIKLTANRIGPNVHISLHDNGPGIPQEYLARIFQKFVQVKGRETGGSGLGLAICMEIVRAHGGAIWAESTAGQGSTFTFTIPVAT